MSRESTIQANVKKKILGMYPDAQVRVLHGTGYAVKGDPDIYACAMGRTIVVETKQPGKRATKVQQKKLRDWAKAGAIAIEAVSADFVGWTLEDPLTWERYGKVYQEYESLS